MESEQSLSTDEQNNNRKRLCERVLLSLRLFEGEQAGSPDLTPDSAEGGGGGGGATFGATSGSEYQPQKLRASLLEGKSNFASRGKIKNFKLTLMRHLNLGFASPV